MKIEIKKPCDADWNKMKIGLNSRHCDLCSKNVVDFRSKSREDILLYLLENSNQKTCGRFQKSQLDYVHVEEMITISALRKLPQNKAFAILTMACFILSSCTSAPEKSVKKSKPDTTLIAKTSIDTFSVPLETSIKTDTTIKKTCTPKDPIEQLPIEIISGEVEIMGDVMELPMEDTTEIYNMVEVMPEFPGGMDSLFAFVRKNLTYPTYEKEHGIEGRVYVQFVVDGTGKIIDPKILRSIPGAKTIDDEVINLIHKMPLWKPGIKAGKPVAVYFTLPVSFKL